MTAAKQWSAEVIVTAAAAQGIALSPGRAERLALAHQALLEAGAGDPLRTSLAFEADPPGFLLALRRCAA